MDLHEKLSTLEEQLQIQLNYHIVCNSTGSLLNYSNEDFERESMLKRKIQETNDFIEMEKTGQMTKMIADKPKQCKTLRLIAMTWWNDLHNSISDSDNPNDCKGYYAQKHYSRHWTTLTGSEIEYIYKQLHIIQDEKNIIK